MTNSNKVKWILSFAEFFCIVVFFVACWQSGRAMDKTGIGDLERFAFWNRNAGISVTIFFLLWIIAITNELYNRQRNNFPLGKAYGESLVPHVLLPPSVLVVGWLILLVFG